LLSTVATALRDGPQRNTSAGTLYLTRITAIPAPRLSTPTARPARPTDGTDPPIGCGE